MKKFILGGLFLSFLAISCKKDDNGGPTISSLDCSNVLYSATAVKGSVYFATATLPYISYIGNNNVNYSADTPIISTGVEGLTASLQAGILNGGNGNLYYTISGTPIDTGKAYFAISFGGKSCSIELIVFSVGSYMTYDAGKQWNYEENNSGTITNYILSATSNLEIKSGREYHVFTNSSDNSSEYYAKSGSNYYTWTDLGMSGAQYENKYLVDNSPVNNTWDAGTVIINIDTTFNGLNANIDATIVFRKKIINNNDSLTLNSTNYLNVIHTTTTPEVVSVNLSISGFPISGTTLDLSNSNFQSYYGKKYGVISDTSVLGGTLTIPAIPLLSLPITTVPLDNLINRITTLQSANF